MERYKISVGRDRFDKIPKWVEYTWDDFINRFKNPIVGMETQADYFALPESRQDELKDVGWYIGGQQKSKGSRAQNPLAYRSLITIDLDNCTKDIYVTLDTFMKTTGFKGLCHSTRKHTKEKPRLRLIIPFEPNYGPSGDSANSEYEFIVRKFAASIDVDMKPIDQCTFRPTQFMYWPSTSKGADYYFKEWQGTEVQKDKFLVQGWENRALWPLHYMEKDKENFKPGIKQADPHQKTGLIGAFCRAYTVEKVIEELIPSIYEETVSNEQYKRYSYAAGSTKNGARSYDDGKFFMSWHSTDPAHGEHNAFDLLRIHMFKGHMKKTLKFIANLEYVKEELARDELKENYEAWKIELLRNQNGNCIDKYYNINLILNNIIDLKYNQFTRRFDLKNKGLWFKHQPYLENKDLAKLLVILEEEYGLRTSNQRLTNSVHSVGVDNSYHPIKNYLESVRWDGKKRVEKLLIEMFGTPDTEYYRTIIRKFLLAAITRIYKPGYLNAKFDTVLTLVGEEDIGKSSFFRVLFGEQYFNDSITCKMMENKTGSELLVGMWCVEIADISGRTKIDPEDIKGFVTRISDRFRPAFGTVTEDYPRTCVFGATTNKLEGFLKSLTGNRRWLIVETGAKSVDLARLAAIRDQIWAEAKHLYDTTDEVLYLEDKFVKEMAKKLQNRFIETDSNFEAIKAYVDMPVPDEWADIPIYERRAHTHDYMCGKIKVGAGWKKREIICIAEIWVELYKKELLERTRRDSDNIKSSLIRMGFTVHRTRRVMYMKTRQRTYVREGQSYE